MKQQTTWTPANDLDRRAVRILSKISFGSSRTAKKFVQSLAKQIEKPGSQISDGQRRWLMQLCYNFRRQINDIELIAIGREYVVKRERDRGNIQQAKKIETAGLPPAREATPDLFEAAG